MTLSPHAVTVGVKASTFKILEGHNPVYNTRWSLEYGIKAKGSKI